MRVFRRRPLACRQVVEMVTDYLEGVLSGPERGRLEDHLADCPHCTEYLRQIRTVISLTGQLTPDDLSPEMQEDFLAIYRRWRSETA